MNVSVDIKVSRKRAKQNEVKTGNIIFISFLFLKLDRSYTESEEDDPPLKKKSSAAPIVISNRPQRACKQKTVDYRV